LGRKSETPHGKRSPQTFYSIEVSAGRISGELRILAARKWYFKVRFSMEKIIPVG
jgi:hypothetical protein